MTDAAVGELGLPADLAHVARVNRTITLLGLLRYVAYRMPLRLLRFIVQISSTAHKIRVCFIAIYADVGAAPGENETKVNN